MSTQEAAPIPESELNPARSNGWMLLDLGHEDGETLPRAMRLNSTSGAMVRALLNTTIDRMDAQIIEQKDPLSNLPVQTLEKIGNNATLKKVAEMMVELDEETDQELLHEVVMALRQGNKGREMIRDVMRIVSNYAMEPPEVRYVDKDAEDAPPTYYFLAKGDSDG